ncbi:ABC transporter permease [Acinetobacter larvae]|uniref:Multidrug ABC transporter permease n=1 Tax=Acinetobacter larvae TaxID=1789224 RepID=A0A1B2M1E2_9GAMM|nr:ABC transporter permease [Acinetobacter larvae]AOA59012.1 multidrug ABC transporter permease [Acinetobacter larvae]
MWAGIQRELKYLIRHKWDFCLTVLAPLLVIVLFSAMFMHGKPEHVPIGLIDQDQGELSHQIDKYLSLNHSLAVVLRTSSQQEAEQQLNQNKIWGYVQIPAGAEQRLVQGKDAEIAIVYNQSYFSLGNTISSAMLVSSLKAIGDFAGNHYLLNLLPDLDLPSPHVKISPLFNPSLNYEFYLGPFIIPAVLHLLLCCCVAFAVGQEFKYATTATWLNTPHVMRALFAKILVYVIIFCLWTWLWLFWLVEIRGWFIAGSLSLLMLAQFLFYLSYALLSATVVIASKNLAKTFGILAVYGGSSLSFAGVTLPLNNAPLFTQTWALLIPYTPYARLQTEQWVVGSPISTSLPALWVLIFFCVFFSLCCAILLKKYKKGMSL